MRAFEELFARVHHEPAAVSTGSGTAALHLVCHELGLRSGDEVLVPALTFAATANAVLYTGARPVFVDVDPVTYTMDPRRAAELVSPRTRAILVVHLYGHPTDMDPLLSLGRRCGLAVIEDATEALGSLYKGQPCGTIGDFGCFSFNGNKVITAAGGGMVLARERDRLEHIRHLSLQARVPATLEYEHDEVGFNYVLSNLHAAVGLAQLERLDQMLARRRSTAARYAEALKDAEDLHFSVEQPWAHSNYWLMSVLVQEGGRTRAQLAHELDRAGVDARPFFTPLPALTPYSGSDPATFPVARDLHARGLNIPSSASLEPEQQERVIEVLLSA